MPIHDATYTISNVAFSNFIALPIISSNTSDVVACLDDTISGSKWKVIPLRGLNRYHIQNDYHQSLYAWCEKTEKGQRIVGSPYNRTEWIIKETNRNGHYLISPAADEELFWGLEDNKSDTTIELNNGPTFRQNQWQFHHSGSLVVENIIDDLELTLDWLDTTTEAPFRAHVSGTIQRSDLPADASISFPKSLPLIWNKLIIGHVNVKAIFGATQADEHADNALVTPSLDDCIIYDFVRALLQEKSISVEIQVEEVTVRAGYKDYPNKRVKLRKSITVGGFDYLNNQITVERMRIIGSEDNGGSLTACADIVINNPSIFSVLVDELPVDVYYGGVKIAFLTIPTFKLHHILRDTKFRAEVSVKFQPENSRDIRCKEFIAKYITTQESIGLSLSLEKTIVKLAAFRIPIPHFWASCTVDGMDKRFLTGITAYVSLIRTPLTKKFDFTFDFENPIDTPLTITFIEGNMSRKKIPLSRFKRNMDMTIKANATLTSGKFRKASLRSMRNMTMFFGKKEIRVDVDIQRANINVGKFNLPDLTFNNLTDIRATLKRSLY